MDTDPEGAYRDFFTEPDEDPTIANATGPAYDTTDEHPDHAARDPIIRHLHAYARAHGLASSERRRLAVAVHRAIDAALREHARRERRAETQRPRPDGDLGLPPAAPERGEPDGADGVPHKAG